MLWILSFPTRSGKEDNMTIKDVSDASLHTRGVNLNYIEENQLRIKSNKEHQSEENKDDSIYISQEARKLEQTITDLKKLANEIPEVRHEKMEEIKQKIKEDFYDRPEVILQTAEKIMDVFGTKK
ncbi:MAG: flagellar biosynthesis anti-sigma factor FlgM [Candidatus Brocadia sp. AMX3]|jgi:anti-sigma28 factor (negative regulator of flagellin synthesis)|nr:flagellar biosynthesis anti-sigma factor FlgM [Candidatus Brocadia sp. AMX3]OQZ00311.1 MAG: hypothetical protein B6D35_06880 [Candidatus Brocadia sp. UTAMX2]